MNCMNIKATPLDDLSNIHVRELQVTRNASSRIPVLGISIQDLASLATQGLQ